MDNTFSRLPFVRFCEMPFSHARMAAPQAMTLHSMFRLGILMCDKKTVKQLHSLLNKNLQMVANLVKQILSRFLKFSLWKNKSTKNPPTFIKCSITTNWGGVVGCGNFLLWRYVRGCQLIDHNVNQVLKSRVSHPINLTNRINKKPVTSWVNLEYPNTQCTGNICQQN